VKVMRQLWQHSRSHEVFAVEFDGTHVLGACGPLDYQEQRENLLTQMPYDAQLGAEIDRDQASYFLTRQPPPKLEELAWTWKSLQRWLIVYRPTLGLGTLDGVRGYYRRDAGLRESFVPCGFKWRDVAARLGAVSADD
jgi:hypothetical protein